MKISHVDDLKDEFICDNPSHSNESEAHAQVTVHFWYGSKNDMKQGSIHLCDECADKVISFLEKEFQLKNFLKPIAEF